MHYFIFMHCYAESKALFSTQGARNILPEVVGVLLASGRLADVSAPSSISASPRRRIRLASKSAPISQLRLQISWQEYNLSCSPRSPCTARAKIRLLRFRRWLRRVGRLPSGDAHLGEAVRYPSASVSKPSTREVRKLQQGRPTQGPAKENAAVITCRLLSGGKWRDWDWRGRWAP